MTRTLHMYISRELARVMVLALIAFTLVMTMFAVIEPLRKRGLGAEQVLSLFGYTLPFMFSLTLPFAALFAATIVYGRFSQDNELLACRASGISTVSLLKPAVILGALVTLASLALSNYVTPHVARLSELAIKANARGIVLSQLQNQGYYKFNNNIIHADSIELEGDSLRLRGVVYCDTLGGQSDTEKVKGIMPGESDLFIVASSALVQFDTYDGETYATVELENPCVTRNDQQVIGTEALQRPVEALPVPNPFKEKASFSDWRGLIRAMDNPVEYREIAAVLEDIKRAIRHDMFARDVVEKINSTGQYDRLSDRHETYVIKAASATVAPKLGVTLSAGTVNGKPQKVEVTVLSDGKPRQVAIGETGLVKVVWSSHLNVSLASIELKDSSGVIVTVPGEGQEQSIRRSNWSVAQLTLPQDVTATADAIKLSDLFRDSRKYTSNSAILKRMDTLQNRDIRKFMGDITGELHARVAFSVSCFLMVAMGAGLGLIYRGGQLVSAFAICAVPTAIVLIVIIMGKELSGSPGVLIKYGMIPGLASIWGGISILAIANLVIYYKLVRQ